MGEKTKEPVVRFFSCSFWRTGFWFRIYGRGLSVCIARYHQKLFSERNGNTKPLYILGLRIEWLKSIQVMRLKEKIGELKEKNRSLNGRIGELLGRIKSLEKEDS